MSPFVPKARNEPDVYETSDLPEDDQAEFEAVRPHRGGTSCPRPPRSRTREQLLSRVPCPVSPAPRWQRMEEGAGGAQGVSPQNGAGAPQTSPVVPSSWG